MGSKYHSRIGRRFKAIKRRSVCKRLNAKAQSRKEKKKEEEEKRRKEKKLLSVTSVFSVVNFYFYHREHRGHREEFLFFSSFLCGSAPLRLIAFAQHGNSACVFR